MPWIPESSSATVRNHPAGLGLEAQFGEEFIEGFHLSSVPPTTNTPVPDRQRPIDAHQAQRRASSVSTAAGRPRSPCPRGPVNPAGQGMLLGITRYHTEATGCRCAREPHPHQPGGRPRADVVEVRGAAGITTPRCHQRVEARCQPGTATASNVPGTRPHHLDPASAAAPAGSCQQPVHHRFCHWAAMTATRIRAAAPAAAISSLGAPCPLMTVLLQSWVSGGGRGAAAFRHQPRRPAGAPSGQRLVAR